MNTKTISKVSESETPPSEGLGETVIQDNLDYTLFSWSKQKGIVPIAVKHAEGVYLYDECKYWSWQPTDNRCSSKTNAGSELCNA